MANCPNCGRKLHWSDWRPECPGCGINLNYYKANEKLLADCEKAEIEHAKFQPKIDRAKGATIGQKKGIFRMILFFMPVLSLFLPIFSITVFGKKTNYNILGFFRVFSQLKTKEIFSAESVIVLAAALCVLSAALGVVFMILQVTAGTQKGLTRNIVFSCASFTLAIVSFVCMVSFSDRQAGDYSRVLLIEAEYTGQKGNQSQVDETAQRIRDVFNDKTVDTSRLEKAIEKGKKALGDAADRGYNEEQKTALKTALDDAQKTLLNAVASNGDLEKAARALNTATAVYNDLETAIRYASLIQNNGSISKESFDSLSKSIKDGREMLIKLANGIAIVDGKDEKGGVKASSDIKRETDNKLRIAANEINGAINSLVDVSGLTQLSRRLSDSVHDGTAANADVTWSFESGILLLIGQIAVQLVFNILIKKEGYEIKYTPCCIGGLPSEEYFRYIEQGMSKEKIYRKMLAALAEMQDEAE